MRNLAADMDPTVVAKIDRDLAVVETEELVRVPWAIESGSRAWGFPSPDSDYDCRFIYVRPLEDYLSPWGRRDVIELPMDEIFDVNGWDLAKGIRLLVKGNAVLTEWLRSPLIYRGEETFRDEFLQLAEEIADPARTVAHHLHVGLLQWTPGAHTPMKLKKVLYSVRSAATLNWLRVTGAQVPPMDLPTLIQEGDLPENARHEIGELIERKRSLAEAATIVVPDAIARFVNGEFQLAELSLELTPPQEDRDAAQAAAEAFFQRVVLNGR